MPCCRLWIRHLLHKILKWDNMPALNFTIEQQQYTEWCWAAVAAAVCRCYGDSTPTRQCEVANLVLRLPFDNCSECNCEWDQSALCNQPRNLASVLDRVQHDRGNPIDGISSLGFDEVREEINTGHPVVVRISLDEPAAGGHAIAIYRYADDHAVARRSMHAKDKISVPFAAFAAGGKIDLGGLHGTWQGAYI